MAALIPSSSPYQAQWPRQLDPERKSTLSKVAKVFWDVISVIIFPIGLCRLFGSFARSVSYLVAIPGNMYIDKVDLASKAEFFLSTHQAERIGILTPDGGKIDGAFIEGQVHPKKVLIVAGGNCEQWETQNWTEKLKPLGTSLLSINSRGVGESSGTRSGQGYALDYYSAYEYLIHKKGISPKDILLVGFSMGAANGTCGASLIQQKYPGEKISAINICSFFSLQKVVTSPLEAKSPKLAYVIKTAMKLLDIEIHAQDAWRSLKGTRCFFFNRADEVIPFEASLAKIADAGSRAVEMFTVGPHCRGFYPEEKRALFQQIREILDLPVPYMDYFHESMPIHTVSEKG